jgi:rhodanese-related sulfurtransferase
MLIIRKPFGVLIEALLLIFVSLVAGTVSNALMQNGVPLMVAEKTAEQGMSVQEAVKLHEGGAVFVDARESGPYGNAHVPGAINIPPGAFMDEIKNRLSGVGKDDTVVVYCSSSTCPMAEQLAQSMQLMGYSGVRVFEPGFLEWRLAGAPVEEE